jgi:hypothetical protein
LRTLLISVLIATDLLALWVWAAGPPRVYSEWLGLGHTEDAPIARLLAWAGGVNGPRTPSGCLSRFDPGELLFAGLLLFALLLLIVALARSRTDSRLGLRSAWRACVARAGSVRFRLRTALAAIAILGLYLGWELDAWRIWRLRNSYLYSVAVAAQGENSNRVQLRSYRDELAKLDADHSQPADLALPGQGFYRSKAALAAERAASGDWLKREANYQSAMVAAYAARKRKYEWAAANPRAALAPDPPLPTPEPEASRWLAQRDYARALAAYDQRARAYPDLVEPHLECAWVRATCPDASYRDGKRAVASATRACELTSWKDTRALEVLAAACAEAGDYAEAVNWQQKAMALPTNPSFADHLRDRLDLYRAGKPYREK